MPRKKLSRDDLLRLKAKVEADVQEVRESGR